MRRRGLRPDGAVRLFGNHCEIIQIAATSKAMKATRGTKRICRACARPFYDLPRDPIVCPSCGAHHIPEASVAETGTRAAAYTDKTSWRGGRVQDSADRETEPDVAVETAATDDAPEEGPAPKDDVVLDEEPDETDISDLLGHNEPGPKER